MDIRQDDQNGNQEVGQESMSRQDAGSSGIFGVVIGLMVLIVLAAGAWFWFSSDNSTSFSGPVAVVNGEEVAGEELSRQLNSLQNSTSTQAQQFDSLSETQQQGLLLEGIINTELQLQAAEEAGVTVSDEEVDQRLQSQIDQIGQDQFEERLATNDTTREEVRGDLREQMIINNFVQQEAGGEITATDTEVQEMYDQYAAQLQQSAGTSTNQVPPLEQFRSQIESAVIQQKQQEILTGILEDARAEADIEVLLEGVEYPASMPTGPAAGTSTSSATSAAPTQPTQ